MLLSHLPLSFSNSKWDALFNSTANDYSHADWDDLHVHLKDVRWENICKLAASVLASELCEWVQIGFDVYSSCCKYQVEPHSLPWFSAVFAAAMAHRSYFIRLWQHDKSFMTKSEV